MERNKSALAIDTVMIITSFCLMQWHSIQFWLSAAGPSGWAWSIGLEIAMLCLWYDRKYRFLKYIAAAILIAGPWYQMTSPAIQNIQKTNAIETEIEIETQRLDQLSKSLDTYQENSRERLGWRDEIRETESAINELSPRIKELHTELSKQNSTWREYMVTSVQSAALLIILMAQLSAVSNLGTRQTEGKKPSEPKRKTKQIEPVLQRHASEISKASAKSFDSISTPDFDHFDATVETVAAEIITELSKHNSQKALAQTLGIDQKSISLILNHKKRKLSGTERISSNALNKVLKGLERHRQSRQNKIHFSP